MILIALSLASGRGSVLGIVGGAALLYASLVLQAWSFGLALRGGRPAFGVAVFLLKLALLLGVAFVGLHSTLIAPMSFAAGATTLLLAILIDTCYGTRPASDSGSSGR